MKENKKIISVFICILLYVSNVQANTCAPVNFTHVLSTQAAVDSFPIYYPGCTDFDGNITISGNNITNLNGLSNLMYIQKKLIIKDNTVLTNLSGLNAVIDIGEDLIIENNAALANLSGLDALVEVRDNFDIINNSALVTLNGLNSLKYVDFFVIRDNSRLKNMSGLNNLDSTSYSLTISNNNSLNSLQGLDNFRTTLWLTISSNPLLTNMNGLGNLRNVFEGLGIGYNNSLVNLNGLNNLNKVGWLDISFNPLLREIKGLNGLTHIGLLQITDNASLIDLIGLENVTKLSGGCRIINNASLSSLNGLNNLDSVGGFYGLSIQSNNSLINLIGLEHLTTVYEVGIINNVLLSSLNGLNSSIKIGRLFLYDNIKLNCCYIAKQILENNPQIDHIGIYNNDNGCNSETEIRSLISSTQCCVPHTITTNKTICTGSSFTVGTHTYTTAGTYADTIHFATGCDSIITTHLTVRPTTYQIITKDLCVGQRFILSNGKIITSNGTYKDTIPNFCDSIIEYRIRFLNNITTTQNATICKGMSYTLPKGKTVTTAGTYKDTLRSSFGCDSIITTTLSVTNPTPFTQTVSICKGKSYTLPSKKVVTTSGMYTDTIIQPNTCDSIIITRLTVNPYLQSTQNIMLCLGKSYTLPSGKEVNQTGVYTDTIQNIAGCDSLVITNISITNPTPYKATISLCEGQYYTLPSGFKVNTTGIYTDTIRQVNTCDSVVITTLSVFPNTFMIQLHAIDSIDQGNAIQLQPKYTSDSAVQWLWTPTESLSCALCENPLASPIENTLYKVIATAKNGCVDTATTQIIVRTTDVYIPTAFSPNNDGVNDNFTIFATNPTAFNLKIYNRWGQVIFESFSIQDTWNGTYQGEAVPMDSYVYTVEVVMPNGNHYHKQGIINVIK